MRGRMPAVVAVVEILLVAIVLVWKRLDGLDLDVYRLGTQAFFTHGDPYGVLPPTHDGTVLPFTYPPFAAIVFAPLLAVSLDTALIADHPRHERASRERGSKLVFQGDRVGDPAYIGNRSLRGLIARLGGGEPAWLLAAAMVLVLTA